MMSSSMSPLLRACTRRLAPVAVAAISACAIAPTGKADKSVEPTADAAVARQVAAATSTAAAATATAPSATAAGDAVRGRAIVVNRQLGLCLLCHAGPFPEERFQGDLAPDLRGTGSRHTAAALRERLVDPRRSNPASIMPAYAQTDGLARVAPALRGAPLLTPQQIDDVVAFLVTLT